MGASSGLMVISSVVLIILCLSGCYAWNSDYDVVPSPKVLFHLLTLFFFSSFYAYHTVKALFLFYIISLVYMNNINIVNIIIYFVIFINFFRQSQTLTVSSNNYSSLCIFSFC